MAAPQLTPEEVTSICSAAQAAWNKAKPKAVRVPFKWRSKPFVASHTIFRLVVSTPDGQSVACRYD